MAPCASVANARARRSRSVIASPSGSVHLRRFPSGQQRLNLFNTGLSPEPWRHLGRIIMSSLTEELRDAFDVRGRGLQPQGLRRANERAVLTVIAFYPGSSNAEIARRAGLAPQTVSAILSDCEQ